MNRIPRLVLAIAISAIAFPTRADTHKIAPLHLARSSGNVPIRDPAGRIYCMVDLTDDAHEGFANVVAAKTRQRFDQRHSAKAQNMVGAYEKQYGFEYTDMTSWVGNSFAAYLTQQQVEGLRADPRVVLISEVIPAHFSAPPWYDSTHSATMPPYYETSSWGRNAVNGNISNGTRKVYVIDGGVGFHQDLPNVIARVNASCGTNNSGCPDKPVVGCFPHPTHVAGIIGAAYGNKGVAGVDAGVAIVSVSALYVPQNPAICSDPALLTTSVASAMDYVKWDLVVNGNYQVGIVNISINSTDFAPGGTLNAKMASLASQYIGGYNYAGSFVVQSAGNAYQNACQASFGYSNGGPSASDGVMVVGAIDYLGQPVTPANGGFDNHGFAGNGPGSNYGSCVEVWAPGKEILSTWGPNVPYDSHDQATWQSQYVVYDEYIKLSGTSLAAPHVAGVAAYLAETQGLSSPADIEGAVRSLFYSTGQFDHDGLAVNLVKLPNTSPPDAPNAAAFVSQSVPGNMVLGRSYPVSVTMRNTGSNTWSAAAAYRLGSQNPQDNLTWAVGRVEVPSNVPPGGAVTFTFNVTPSVLGSLDFQWRMVQDGVEWFGDFTPNVLVAVSPPFGAPNAAAFVSQSVPVNMVLGQSYPVSVTMRNTGTNMWGAAAAYRLGSQNPQDNLTWGVGRVDVPFDVTPGGAVTFTFNVTPSVLGSLNFQWRMVQDGVEWFGDFTPNLPVVVSPPPIDDFSISLSPTSQTVSPGGIATYSVNTAVTSGRPEAIVFSALGLPPGATAVFSPPSVMAGETSTLTISTTAATPSGTMSFTVYGSAASSRRTATASLTVAATNRMPLYRWWAPSSTDHFYTTTNYPSIPGFILEGSAANVEATQVPGTLPLYRFYHNWPRTDHFYTTDLNEIQIVLDLGYVAEGIEGYIYASPVAGTVPFYRCSWCYCDASGCGDCDHLYTTNPAERDYVVSSLGWGYDGIAGYVWPVGLTLDRPMDRGSTGR